MSAAPLLRLVQNLVDDNGELVGSGLCLCGCGGRTTIAAGNNARRGEVAGQPRKYLLGHRSRINGPDYLEEDRGYSTPCWVWQKSIKEHGYGYRMVGRKLRGAHVIYYEKHIGPVPEGLMLDHLCRVRHCVNPDHLELVTSRENTRRGDRTKLTVDQVRAIREAHSRGVSHKTIAVRFGISKSYVSKVVCRRAWSDVA